MNCSYALALEFQQQTVDAWANHGLSAKDELREATRLLEQIKKKAFESMSNAVSQEALPLSHGSDAVPSKLEHCQPA